MTEPAVTPQHLDPQVGEHLARLQDQWVDFQQVRRQALREDGLGGFARILNEYFNISNKSAYELMLRGMLTDTDKEQLRSDPKFTEAWQIFVELRWPARMLVRGLIIFTCVAFFLVAAAGSLWALYELVIFLTTGRK
jgi:hypothetical protein